MFHLPTLNHFIELKCSSLYKNPLNILTTCSTVQYICLIKTFQKKLLKSFGMQKDNLSFEDYLNFWIKIHIIKRRLNNDQQLKASFSTLEELVQSVEILNPIPTTW